MSDPARYLLIIVVTAAVATGVFLLGNSYRRLYHAPPVDEASRPQLSALSQKSSPAPALPASYQPEDGVKLRKLDEYYSRRAYFGAPPYIPHPVEPAIEQGQKCSVCHERGGFVRKWNAYAPITPHPQYENCLQCHVQQQATDLFVETTWKSVKPPPIHRPALPGSPPPLPHPLQMRENCRACHAGPAAVREVHTTHPERESCRQCHVAQVTTSHFER